MARTSMAAGGLAPLLAVGSLALAIAAALSAARPLDHGPVYSPAEVLYHLARDPHAWVGRVLLVRGEVVPCMTVPSVGDRPCAALAPDPWQPSDPAPPRQAIDPLTLVRGDPQPVTALLRRLPLLGKLLPAPQVLHWGAIATYRVWLRAIAASSCGTGLCFDALLLDAAPGSLEE